MTLRNRVVMAPMTTWSANDDGTISDEGSVLLSTQGERRWPRSNGLHACLSQRHRVHGRIRFL
ncbi:hypothetical protein ACOJBO_34135 [Rhizobium beringeri]